MRITRVRAGQHFKSLQHAPSAAAIGNFDGVHLGHQTLLNQVIAYAKSAGLRSRLYTFDPLPHEFFSAQPPARLSNFRDKMTVLSGLGLDEVILMHFDRALAESAATDFAERWLVDAGVEALWVGEDFRFGVKRSGDVELLAQYFGDRLQVSLDICDDIERISSTRIRRALAQSDVALASSLLGRPFVISGRVLHGDKLGRTIGFPTINIGHNMPNLPLRGVFAARVELAGVTYGAAVNVGVRPTVDGLQPRLEAHILETSGDWYGQLASVAFVSPIRDEIKFDGIDALKSQLVHDIESAKRMLAN
ncbi:MAG: riboflavin biosynthesis protein RibF [Gammaproteobacteria bacterium]|nr:riboflavin biosynthesis protein RibF [Gammaproteobacteria bacterium]